METVTLLEELRRRIPWYSIKPILSQHKIPKSQGWHATIDKILSYISENPNSKQQIEEKLKDGFIEHIFCGEKQIELYQLDTEVTKELCLRLDNFDIEETDFSRSYPFTLTPEKAEENLDNIAIVNIEQSDNLYRIVLCSIRNYEEIVNLHSNDLKENVLDNLELDEDSEIFIKRKNRRQFYDLITINPKSGSTQLRLDWGLGMKQTDADKAKNKIKKFFEELSSKELEVKLQFNKPINLFPLIKKLYETDSIGRVCELYHTVNSGSVKSEKLRRYETDIRNEDFHRGGKEAVDGYISPYRLAIKWTFRSSLTNEARPELLLPGSKAILNDPINKSLSYAIISRCFYESDFLQISNILLDNIQGNDN